MNCSVPAASLALGTLPNGAGAQTAQPGSAASPEWDPGSVAHLLPTSSHDRILIKASFRQPLDGVPALLIDQQRFPGQRTDTRGGFWQFQAGDLKPGTQYRLALVGGDGKALCEPWSLATMPAPDDRPEKLRLLIYSCAGGHDLFARASTGFEFLPIAVRQRLLRRGLSFAPDALIANGDHVYWDLLAPRAAPKLEVTRPRSPTLASTARRHCSAAPTKRRCCGRRVSRSRRSTAPCVARRRSSPSGRPRPLR
ncbi:hypothetical protein [Methylobacterium sp. SI9]|uniref:hypothetical protein n=1 Tax=Methylobacterium guangdongense TaxID=3138811 RepID=UPI00313BE982